MTEEGIDWLTLPDVAERLDVKLSQVRRLIEDRLLLASRVDGVLKVPADFLDGQEPLHDLRGTLIVLGDAGFTDDEAMRWLIAEDDTLGARPVDALRSGRKAEVRRVAQALGF